MERKREHLYQCFTSFCNELPWIEERMLKRSEFNDLTLKELRAIYEIEKNGQVSAKILADALHLAPGTLTITVDRLVKKGYVIRFRSDYDRRAVLIKLSRRGRKLLRADYVFQSRIFEMLIAEMDEEAIGSLAVGFDKVIAYFHEQ